MKKKKNFLLAIAMLFVLSLLLVACGGSEDTSSESNDTEATDETPQDENNDEETDNAEGEEGEDANTDAPEFLSFLTGGTSGTYYPLGGAIAKIITDETGSQTDALSSNASADNIIALQEGDAELAFVQTDVMAAAVDGINAFDGNPVDNVLALGSLYPETIQIVTTAKSGITSVEGLEGKTVSVGAPGSGTYINAEQVLEVHGITMDDIKAENLDFGESVGGIKDGNIDAAFITAGTPTGAVEELTASEEILIVPVEQDKAEALIEKYPYYAVDIIPEGTYGLEEEVHSVAVIAMIAVTDQLSEDFVYEITKSIYENTESIAHAKGEFVTLETALDGIDINLLHPGAKKYYEEQGISTE